MEERIRQVMEYMQMKQKDFAAKIGISEASLSGVFNGRTKANNRHVEGIHKAFPQINLNWLMFGTGEMWDSHQIEQSPNSLETTKENEDSTIPTSPSAITSEVAQDSPALFSAFSNATPQATQNNNTHSCNNGLSNELMQELMYLRELKNKNLLEKKVRKVLEIRVFFDDGTYESFSPTDK